MVIGSLLENDGDSLFLVPTHEALVNIQNTAHAQGKQSIIYS